MQPVLSGTISGDNNPASLPSYDRAQALMAAIESQSHDQMTSLAGTWAMQSQIVLDLMSNAPQEAMAILQMMQRAMTEVAWGEPSIACEPSDGHEIDVEELQSWTIEPRCSSLVRLDAAEASVPEADWCLPHHEPPFDVPSSEKVGPPHRWIRVRWRDILWGLSGGIAVVIVAIVVLFFVSGGQPPRDPIPDPQAQRLN
jgi:hypothetical protein